MISKIYNCISIHNGGGIVYLSMMHTEIDRKGNLILLDYRAKNHLLPFLHAEIKFFKRNIFRNLFVLRERIYYTHLFSKFSKKKNQKNFFCEYYLNGLPPLFRFSISTNKVFILFQNKNLFNDLNYFDRKKFFKLSFLIYHFLHKNLINTFLRKTDSIIVQTNSMKKIISKCKPQNRILKCEKFWKNVNIDFYENYFKNLRLKKQNKLISSLKDLAEINTLFFYPASFDPHKNHKLLLSSFKKVFRDYPNRIKLILTVNPNRIMEDCIQNKNIIFIQNPSLNTIFEIYSFSDYLIFPSLNESLGLPLIEAKIKKLPIIASDLDYVYDVCNPAFTFDPYSKIDIYETIKKAIN